MFVQTHSLNALRRQLTNQGMSERYVTASSQPLNKKNVDKKTNFEMLCAWLSCVHSTKHSILSISLGLAIKNSIFNCPQQTKTDGI